MIRTPIACLRDQAGETVTIAGWAQTLRLQRAMQFVIVRDHTGTVQVTHRRDGTAIESALEGLTAESAVRITGRVQANPVVSLGGLEVIPETVTVENLAQAPAADRRPYRPGGPAGLAVPRPAAPRRRPAGVRGADDRRARDARVRLRRGLHGDAHAQAHGHRVGVGRGGVPGRLLRPPGLLGAVAAVLQADGDRGRHRPGLRGRTRVPRGAVIHLAAHHRVHRRRRGARLDRAPSRT